MKKDIYICEFLFKASHWLVCLLVWTVIAASRPISSSSSSFLAKSLWFRKEVFRRESEEPNVISLPFFF